MCYNRQITTRQALPEFFKPILWSYNLEVLEAEKNKKIIIVNTINYGDLSHWRWIAEHYGKVVVRSVLEDVPASSIRPKARRLASMFFASLEPKLLCIMEEVNKSRN